MSDGSAMEAWAVAGARISGREGVDPQGGEGRLSDGSDGSRCDVRLLVWAHAGVSLNRGSGAGSLVPEQAGHGAASFGHLRQE